MAEHYTAGRGDSGQALAAAFEDRSGAVPSSSRPICLDTPGCEVNKASAAAEGLYEVFSMHCIMEFALNPLLPLSGFAVGLLVGLTGVGGGSLMTPLLVLLFGFKPATAVGTDLLYAAITKAGGSWVHQRHGNIDWAITGRLALGSVPAAGLTLLVLAQLGVQGHAATGLISVVLGIALLLTAASLFFRQRLLDLARAVPPAPTFTSAHPG
jgi:hypothetical protein